MIKKYEVKTEAREENVFWITMSDLLLGLMIIFLTLFILAMVGFTQNSVQEKAAQVELADTLTLKFTENKIPAQIDKLSGMVKISDLQLYKVGSYELSSEGKQYLDKFIPIYLDTIFSNPEISKNLKNIIIVGHTDSQMFKGVNSKNDQYTKNLDLSLLRANELAKYVFKTNYDKKYDENLHKLLIVEGKSYTEPVLIDGKEDFDKSRRVELKIELKSNSFIDKFLK